jgi:hypothetical protein
MQLVGCDCLAVRRAALSSALALSSGARRGGVLSRFAERGLQGTPACGRKQPGERRAWMDRMCGAGIACIFPCVQRAEPDVGTRPQARSYMYYMVHVIYAKPQAGRFMGAMTEEIIFEADPFVETCNRLYSKWKVTYTQNAET